MGNFRGPVPIVGAINPQEEAALKQFKLQLAADISKLIVSTPSVLERFVDKPVELGVYVATAALSIAEVLKNDYLGVNGKPLVH